MLTRCISTICFVHSVRQNVKWVWIILYRFACQRSWKQNLSQSGGYWINTWARTLRWQAAESLFSVSSFWTLPILGAGKPLTLLRLCLSAVLASFGGEIPKCVRVDALYPPCQMQGHLGLQPEQGTRLLIALQTGTPYKYLNPDQILLFSIVLHSPG